MAGRWLTRHEMRRRCIDAAMKVRASPVRRLARLASAPALTPARCSAAFTSTTSTRRSTRSGIEGGADFQLGWRGGAIGRTPLQPYIFGALNTAGDTSYAAAGMSAKFGDAYLCPPGPRHCNPQRLGEEVPGPDQRQDRLRQPRPVRARAGDRRAGQPPPSIEASWVHMSHAQLFGRQNPGIDNFGVRAELRALGPEVAQASPNGARSTAAALAATGRKVALAPRAA